MEPSIRRITTESSVWIFDADLMEVTRLPRNENPDVGHPYLPYEKIGNTRPIIGFFKVHKYGYDRIEVYFPHDEERAKMGKGMYVAWTGEIEHDSNPELEVQPEEDHAAS